MKKISEKIIVDNGYRQCIERVFEFWNGKSESFLVCGKSGHPGWVGILGLTTNNTLILVDEYRVWPEKIVRSCVVWDLETDGNLEVNARREFIEETGYTFDRLIPIIQLINNPYFIGKTSYFLAIWCEKKQEQQLDPSEEIHSIELSSSEIESQITLGGIDCPYLISVYFTAKIKTHNFTTF